MPHELPEAGCRVEETLSRLTRQANAIFGRLADRREPEPPPETDKRIFDWQVHYRESGHRSKSRKINWKVAVVSLVVALPILALAAYGGLNLFTADKSTSSSRDLRSDLAFLFSLEFTIYKPNRLYTNLFSKDLERPHLGFDSVAQTVTPQPKTHPQAQKTYGKLQELIAEIPIDTKIHGYTDIPKLRICESSKYKKLPIVMNPCIESPMNILPPQFRQPN